MGRELYHFVKKQLYHFAALYTANYFTLLNNEIKVFFLIKLDKFGAIIVRQIKKKMTRIDMLVENVRKSHIFLCQQFKLIEIENYQFSTTFLKCNRL